jgi:2-amino-4-hydroxy-6-hydroxymethyldihydropteridine diphosphokinase
MPFCLIGLGSNQGNRQQLLETAVAKIAAEPENRFITVSTWRETTPVGGPPGQPLFLNGALVVETSLTPQEMLTRLQRIEHDLGRRREQRWEQRPIDLDLLLYDDLVLDTPALQVPHPRMAWRRFVLEPSAEVAGAMTHPTTGWTVSRLLQHLNEAPWYVAITGPIAVGKSRLAKRLTKSLSAQLIAERPNWSRLAAFYADPAGHGWQMELEFLDQRAKLLSDASQFATNALPANQRRWTVSDFWFDQSGAFARAWLPPERLPEFVARLHERHRNVVRPKLIVLLDAAGDKLVTRLHARGRPCEQPLSQQQLERIREAILDEVSRPNFGPVLRLNSDDPETLFTETLAAIQAME